MNKTKTFIWLFLVLLCANPILAQNNSYSPLASKGEMPAILQNVLKQKTTEDQYNAFLHQLLLSGDILYGTELNQYVNTVADKLYTNEPELREKIQIFLVKSNIVNASMSKDGILLINIELLAQLSNESELAFIIAHEVAHYTNHHYEKTKKSKDKITTLNSFLKRHNRSREMESQADAIAIETLSTSPYSLKAALSIYDVLLYDDLPFDNIIFPRAEFESNVYLFPDSYFLEEVTPIVVRDNYLDTISTHPNIKQRRTDAEELVENYNHQGATFVQTQEAFERMQYLARCTSLHVDLVYHNYSRALYNSYIMLRSRPNDHFLQLAHVYSYYGLSKHKT